MEIQELRTFGAMSPGYRAEDIKLVHSFPISSSISSLDTSSVGFLMAVTSTALIETFDEPVTRIFGTSICPPSSTMALYFRYGGPECPLGWLLDSLTIAHSL